MPESRNKNTDRNDFPAWRSGWAYIRLISVAIAGFALDLATKMWAMNTLGDPINGYRREPIVIIKGYFQIWTQLNDGAVWSLGSGKTVFLIVASCVALVLLFGLFASTRSGQRVAHIALGMLLAGAMGNLYDRIFNNGRVIDFIEINLHFPPANPWPTFNIADALLCVGVAVLFITMIAGRNKHIAAKSSEHKD